MEPGIGQINFSVGKKSELCRLKVIDTGTDKRSQTQAKCTMCDLIITGLKFSKGKSLQAFIYALKTH